MPQRSCETVMVVNDDPSFVDVVGDSLRAEGLAVLLVPGIPQAMRALLTGFRPDAVLLDVLPRADLRDLLDLLWREPELSRVAVIATTREGEDITEIAPGRAADPLPTPSNPRQLAQLLEDVCARKVSDGTSQRNGTSREA